MSHRPTKLMAVSIKLGADTVAAAGQGVTDLRQRKSEWGANIPLRGLQRPDAWGCPTSDAGPACSPRSPAAPIRQRFPDRRATNRGTRHRSAMYLKLMF